MGVWRGPVGAWPAARPGLAWAGVDAGLRARPPRAGTRGCPAPPVGPRASGPPSTSPTSRGPESVARALRRALDKAGTPGGGFEVVGGKKGCDQGDRPAGTRRQSRLLRLVVRGVGPPLFAPEGDGYLACPWKRFLS